MIVQPFGLTSCLRKEVLQYRNGIFECVANEAVDGGLDPVIKQLQPEQRHAIRMGFRSPEHADLRAANRCEQHRRLWIVLRNGRKFNVGSRNLQFDQRPSGRVAVCQDNESPKKCKTQADLAGRSEMLLSCPANYLR